jgi:DNA-binding IclR family transcriptional regulator
MRVVDGNIILSVAKAMELLQLMDQAGKPLLLKELAALSGYPKSTVFGLLTTMRAYDVVAQTPDGRYALGLRLFEYGRQVERSWDISLVARPYMEHLCQQTGASVMLSVCESGSVITLDQVETRGSLRVVSDTGSRLPIYCTSQGKVFLSHMSRTGAEALLRSQKMTQFTPHTITDIPALLREADQCRANGYAIENGEYKIGLRSISAPVYTVEGKVRYTVGVIGMFRSVNSEEFHTAVERVCATAGMISTALGYRKKEEHL